MSHFILQEEFADSKGAIRIHKSKKNRQHNGQKNKDKRTNKDKIYKTLHIKLKIEYTNPTKTQPEVNSGAPEG